MPSPTLPISAAKTPPGPGRTQSTATKRRLTLLSASLVLGIAGADWQLIRVQRASAIADFRTAANNLAHGFSNQTFHAFMASDTALHGIEQRLAGRPQMSDDDIAAVLRSKTTYDRLSQHLLGPSGITSLAIVDASGHLAATTGAWTPPAQDLSREDPFRQVAARQGATFVGKPRLDPATGQWTSLLARRITGQDGTFAGVLLADMSLAAIEDLYRWGAPLRRRLTLLRADGTIMVRYPPQPDLVGRKVPEGEPWYAAAAAEGAYLAPGYFDHIDAVTAVRRVRDLPLYVEASIDESEVLAGWRKNRVWMIVGGLVASAGAVLLVRLFEMQLKRLALRNTQLDEARQQLDLAMANIAQGMCFFDGQQRLLVCNRRFGEIYRLPPAAMQPGVSYARLVELWFSAGGPAGMTQQDYLTSHAEAMGSGGPQSILELADGRTVAVHKQSMPDGGWVATHEDITERRKAEEQIRYLARHDVLTGVPNRALLMERLQLAIAGARRGPGFAVLFLDLDRFKTVNDTLGHAAGDELLQGVSERLLAAARENDTVARLGGDEFVVLQTSVQSPQAAATLAERIIDEISKPFTVAGDEVIIGVSIGIEVALNDRASADDILKNADMAMYIAKSEGRGLFRFFKPEMDAAVQHRHALERDLRCALERNEFVLHYQPFVEAQTGRACGFEALLRWSHPTRGLVGPGEFIGVAEDCGLIIPIGEWVIREACREASRWPESFHVAVNLSPIQFRAPQLAEVVRDALLDARLAPHRLELEITESVLLHSNSRNMAVMNEFHKLGVGVVMDDFGVGYSSLSYLLQFPFQWLKIDRCFVKELGTSQDAVAVVRAIRGLCRDLGIGIIAEGVETPEQLKILQAEGCPILQGFLFSRPKPAAHIAAMLAGASLLPEEARVAGAEEKVRA